MFFEFNNNILINMNHVLGVSFKENFTVIQVLMLDEFKLNLQCDDKENAFKVYQGIKDNLPVKASISGKA